MADMLKIIVTDSGGEDHIFNCDDSEAEHRLDLVPTDGNGDALEGYVRITTRTFDGHLKFQLEGVAFFLNPRRVDVLYGGHEND